jgi:hypothetical protein
MPILDIRSPVHAQADGSKSALNLKAQALGFGPAEVVIQQCTASKSSDNITGILCRDRLTHTPSGPLARDFEGSVDQVEQRMDD